MDDIPNCDWAAPALVRRGELVLAISTGGASPALAKRLRVQLTEEFGEEWSEVLAVLRAVREETLPLLPTSPRARAGGARRSTSTRPRRWCGTGGRRACHPAADAAARTG